MKSSPEDRLARQCPASFVFPPVFLTFALSLLLSACAGLSSSQPSATKAPTKTNTLSLAPATIDFGTVQLNSVATSLVSITNVGPSGETIVSAIVTNPIFSIQNLTAPVTLEPGQTVQLRPIFAPQSAGNYSGTLTLAMLQPLDPINIPLIGAASAENNPPPIGVSLSPNSAALQSGQSQQFVAAVTGTSNTAITWTAVFGPISSSGAYTAPTVTSQSYDTVSAVSVADATKSATASVTVTPAPFVVGVSLLPTSEALQSGQSKQFEATVTGTPNTAVTWTASLGTVSSSGLYTAPTVTSPTSDTISAISVADSSKSASGSVTVTSATSVVGVSLSPTSAALQSAQSKQFAAVVTGTSNTAVTWTAVLGSITSSGFYTAPTVTNQSSDTASAISVADPSKYASSSVTLTPAPASGTPYSLNANSVTTKLLPADVLSHCYGNTSNCAAGDAIAKCAMTDCGGLNELSNPTYMGLFRETSPGNSDSGNTNYYSAPSDPWYKITAATPTGAQTVTFRAPSGALYPEGVEFNMVIWDQSTGWVVGMYDCCGPQTGRGLPVASGCGSTQALACVISAGTYKSAAANFFTAQDYGYTPNADSSVQFAPSAGTIREQELMNGTINHALLFTVDCVNATTPFVFPSLLASLGLCGTGPFGAQNVNRASGGTLLFLDYTPAELAIICPTVPTWQCAYVTAFSTYGGYVTTTGGANIGLWQGNNMQVESSEAWKYAYPSTFLTQDPFWAWANTQKGFNGNNNLTQVGCGSGSGTNPSTYKCEGFGLANIGRYIGPEGSDAEGNSCTTGLGCYPSGHIHAADICVAKGYAGLPGGCS